MNRDVLLLILMAASAQAGEFERPWQSIIIPNYKEAYRQFRDPPPEYALTMWWWWNGPMTESDIRRDLRDMRAHGIRSVMIWAMAGLGIEYLSPVWFQRVRFAVEEARSLNMRVWLMDEGGYPSGFVGGRVTRHYPRLGMRMLTVERHPAIRTGERLRLHLPDGFLSAAAISRRGEVLPLPGSAGRLLDWIAPAGEWEAVIVSERLSTSPTRYVHSPGFRKDVAYSLIDLMNPVAVDRFIQDVHAEYEKHIGAEFGRTVLGFMSDEPNYSGPPWTPAFPGEFRKRKGYDLTPHLAEMLTGESERARRLKADYYEVWTHLFSEGIFRRCGDWCRCRNLEYMTHLWGEDQMKTLISHHGDYFTVNQAVQIPGVDAVWREIWPHKQPYFPKLASSAAHLYGRPRAFTESFAAYGAGLSIEQAKWVIDYQLARGINLIQTMAYLSSEAEYRPYLAPPSWSSSPLWPYFGDLAAYVNRLSYILSVGRPTARTAILYPVRSGWLGDFDPEKAMAQLAQQRLEQQRDFDFISEEGIHTHARLDRGRLVNRSGQAYEEVLIPPGAALTRATRERLARLRNAAPEPDLELQAAAAGLRYVRRRLANADVFFLFNEGGQQVRTTAVFRAEGTPETWDPMTGERSAVPWRRAPDGRHAVLPLALAPGETKLIVFSAQSRPAIATGSARLTVATTLEGPWQIELNGKTFNSELKPWSQLGQASFWGTARYLRRIEWRGPPGCVLLDLGQVRYAARVRLNGMDLGRRAWGPFRWALKGALRTGVNWLEIEVANTRANEVAADPVKRLELEQRGWARMSMLDRYLHFDAEMVPSGLLGPVRLLRDAPPR